MAHPAPSRNRGALLLGVSVVCVVIGFTMPDGGQRLSLQLVLALGGLMGTVFGAVWLLVRWDEARRYDRLKAGRGVVARWTVDSVRWEWFREQSLEWDRRAGEPPNNADLTQKVGATGLEIVVTREAILIGEDFHPLEKDVAIQSYDQWMEFDQTIQNQDGPNLHRILRIPLASGEATQAVKIEQVYREAFGEAAGNPKFKIYAALIIFVGLPALTGLIALIANLLKR